MAAGHGNQKPRIPMPPLGAWQPYWQPQSSCFCTSLYMQMLVGGQKTFALTEQSFENVEWWCMENVNLWWCPVHHGHKTRLVLYVYKCKLYLIIFISYNYCFNWAKWALHHGLPNQQRSPKQSYILLNLSTLMGCVILFRTALKICNWHFVNLVLHCLLFQYIFQQLENVDLSLSMLY